MEFVSGNRLTLLTNGEAYFPALVDAIDAAGEEIFLETYIFADDQTGSLVASALCRAAQRGAATRVLIDGFGARDLAPRFRAMFTSSGVELLVFRPDINPFRIARRRLRRMHRKIACIDRRVAFVGGINIIDDYDTPGQTPPRYDHAVRIEGPLVARAREEVAHLWSRVSWASRGRRFRAAPIIAPTGEARGAAGTQRAALVVRDNVRHRSDIERAYLDEIAAARDEVVIACAYFLPGRAFRAALADAVRRGVRVVLVLQGRVEYRLLHFASRALYHDLLEDGVEILEYHRSFLHAKVAVFDLRTACVGSSNIDPFSFLLAREANVFVEDNAFSRELRRSLGEAIEAGTRPIRALRWRRRPYLLRLCARVAYLLARALIALAGYEQYH